MSTPARRAAARSRRGVVPGTIYGHGARRTWTWIGLDAAAILLLTGLACLGWITAFGTAEVYLAAFGGAVLGLGIGIVSALRRWGLLLTCAVAVVAYLVCGTALVMPEQATAYVVPTLRSFTALVAAPVTVWRDVLMITPPIGETGAALAAPLLVAMVAALGGISIGLRSGAGSFAFLPPLAALAVAYTFGTGRPVAPVWVGVAVALLVIAWISIRRRSVDHELVGRSARIGWLRVALGVLVLALAGGVGGIASPGLHPIYRGVARDLVQPPLDLYDYPSPLQGYRANLVDHKNDVLFHVDGLPEGGRVRIATLDTYDGYVAGVSNTTQPGADSGAFRRVGTRVPLSATGRSADVTITVQDYAGPWVPTVGVPSSLKFAGARRDALTDDLFYNPQSQTAISTAQLRAGDSYRVGAVVPTPPSAADLAHLSASSLTLPQLGVVPDQVADLASKYTAGAVGAGDQALKIERALKQGYFSNGQQNEAVSAPGHSAARIKQLLSSDQPMIGNEEQYAVAMMLIARTVGLPARVVYGYAPKGSGSVDVTGNDVLAWVEISFDGAGWVAFNPCPPHDRIYKDPTPPDENHPRPQVENPPPPPTKPEQLPPDNTAPQQPKPDEKEKIHVDWAFIGALAAAIGIPLALVVAPIVTIVALKLRRRRRRRSDPHMGARIAGGWAELVDRARDLGARLPGGLTRSEQAAALGTQFAQFGDSVDSTAMARQADAGSFAPEEQEPDVARRYWEQVHDGVGGLRRSRPWWRRAAGTLSLASLRHR